jgi:putative hydrolase of the HAD superfamily
MIQGVVFDWGGTLTAPIEVVYEIDTWSRVAKALLPERHEELAVRLGAIEAELWEDSRTTQRSGSLNSLIARVVQEFGIDVAVESLEEATRFHLEALAPHIRHDPDAAEVLAALKERGLQIALLSNTLWPDHFHEELLESAGLKDLIDARLYTSHMERTKPHPDAFRAALDAIGIAAPADAAFVGDRPFDDIHGAQSFGMRTVLRPNALVPSHEVVPDATIENLPALLDVIDGWQDGRQDH